MNSCQFCNQPKKLSLVSLCEPSELNGYKTQSKLLLCDSCKINYQRLKLKNTVKSPLKVPRYELTKISILTKKGFYDYSLELSRELTRHNSI